MEVKHQRERFNRNCVASSRGAYVMHSHKRALEENHQTSTSFFAAIKHVPVYYAKCSGKLIPITLEQAITFPQDIVVIK
jgi:hypothetical protein